MQEKVTIYPIDWISYWCLYWEKKAINGKVRILENEELEIVKNWNLREAQEILRKKFENILYLKK